MARLRRRLGVAGLAMSVALAVLFGYRALVQTAGSPFAFPSGADVAAPAPAGRPIGLVQAGNSKATCVYVKDAHVDLAAAIRSVEKATGMTYACLEAYANADVTWSAWADPWLTKPQYGYTRWLAAAPRQRTVVLAISLVPDAVAATANWRARCAAGAFRPHARQLARRLVATGFASTVIRLGPEMNGTWYRDSIGPDPDEWPAWDRCFAQIVQTMRAVRGAHFLFDWNVNAGYLPIRLARYYPGNRYVDIIGVDAYDTVAAGTLPPPGPRRWRLVAGQPYGLLAVARFARAHHKPLSIPEWGTEARGGDDGSYVQGMARVVLDHDVAYESWFDSGTSGILDLSPHAPRSLASYIASFGPGSPIAHFHEGVLDP